MFTMTNRDVFMKRDIIGYGYTLHKSWQVQ